MRQPNYRQDALRLNANFKATKDEVHHNQFQDGQVESRTIEMTPEKVITILRAISDADLIAMGLSPDWARPEWMLITILPVPPMPVRPSISVDGMGRGEDDLTHKLSDIIKANITLKHHEADGAPAHIIKELENLLQYHVATYMDNDIAGLPPAQQKSGRPVHFN